MVPECHLEMQEGTTSVQVSVMIVKNGATFDHSMQSTVTSTDLDLVAEIKHDATKEMLNKRKTYGKRLGRPQGALAKNYKLDDRRSEIERYLKLGINQTAIAKLVGVSRLTLRSWLVRNQLIGS